MSPTIPKILRFLATTPSTGIDHYCGRPQWLNGYYEGKSGPHISMKAFREMIEAGYIKMAMRCQQSPSQGWYFLTAKGLKASS